LIDMENHLYSGELQTNMTEIGLIIVLLWL